MRIRYFILGLAVAASTTMAAQTKKNSSKDKEATSDSNSGNNIVSNPGFEVGDGGIKTLKAVGMLNTFCPEWGTPNKTSADLYHVESKSPKTAAPANDYGTQMPYEGNSYAGVRAYSKDPKKSRTYLQAKFPKKLTKDKLYCVKFNVSLADNSKFAVNNFGVFISDRKIQNANDFALSYQPQILEKTNKVINTTEAWETICGTYLATGNEEYFIIGAFGQDDKLKVEKPKKGSGSTGIAQNDAYYFIDGIEIIEVEANSQCTCGRVQALEPDLIYSRASAKPIDAKPAQIIDATTVWFAFLSTEIAGMFDAELDEVAELLKANAGMNLELTAHSETDEVNEAKINRQYNDIASKRAEAVKQALVERGIAASRITVVSKDNTAPATDRTTPMGKAQNRRVEFKVK
jgi:OOP family OmpA-OmpF porin